MEDGDCNIHLRNLSTHPARDEEDALNLLFQGDTNRMIAEVGAASLAARETKTNKQTNKINKKKKTQQKKKRDAPVCGTIVHFWVQKSCLFYEFGT